MGRRRLGRNGPNDTGASVTEQVRTALAAAGIPYLTEETLDRMAQTVGDIITKTHDISETKVKRRGGLVINPGLPDFEEVVEPEVDW